MISLRDRVDLLVRFLFGGLIAIGCYLVILPFLTAMMVAAVIAVVSWPLFLRTRSSLRNSATGAAAVMVLAIVLLLIVPLSMLAVVAGEQVPQLAVLIRRWIADGFTVPAWIDHIPGIGNWLHDQLMSQLGNKEQLAILAKRLVEPATKGFLGLAVLLGDGLLQLVMVAFIVFFFYRDGDRLAAGARNLLKRMSGTLADEVGSILVHTTRSVVVGIVGTAAAQALVALVGFLIAGVPAAPLLAFAVFVLSVVPIGPPLIWGGAAIWLYSQGEPGWAFFMAMWGALVISSVDNVVKPLLIARGTPLPISLVFLGVLGGVLAFGFIGLILGPVLLAVGIAMGREWLKVASKQGHQAKT
ncbi:MAG: AI-2E family transporter [Burkholderiaceae bacterium]